MLVDMDKRTLVFFRNGRRLGRAFDDLPVEGALYPAASAHGKGARVRLICRPSSAAEVQRVLAAESALLTATEAGSLSMSYPM